MVTLSLPRPMAVTGRIPSPSFGITIFNSRFTTISLLKLGFATMASGHGNHGGIKIPEGQTISADPIDAILYIHILLQIFVYGILFPLGMVLGIIKSRFHVPCQIIASLLALVGAVLGHTHRGREFVAGNIHETFANPLQFLLLLQIVFGVYLKMHLERGINGRIRPFIRTLHSFLGKSFPIISWAQILFGGITSLGLCQGNHVGQCVAHFVMGSAFIAYGTILMILLMAGQAWLARTGRSQEFFDSAVIAAWGCVNTFTEHKWGAEWVRNDWQHTTMGIVWWCAGLAGVWLSKDRDGRPQRNFIPGMVLIITGWAFSAHPQELIISEKVHQMFGYALIAAGLSRIIEISFICKDRPSGETGKVWSWQYVPVYMLFASGFLFMGATEEQMELVAMGGLDHVSYILITYGLAFLAFLFVNMLLSVYYKAQNTPSSDSPAYVHVPGGRMGESSIDARRLEDAHEFELDELVSDDDEEVGLTNKHGEGVVSIGDRGLENLSTVGRNNHGRVI